MRIKFECQSCGKRIWVSPEIHAREYEGQGLCLSCRSYQLEQEGQRIAAAELIGEALALRDDRALVKAMADWFWYTSAAHADPVKGRLLSISLWLYDHEDEAMPRVRELAILALKGAARRYGMTLPEDLERDLTVEDAEPAAAK